MISQLFEMNLFRVWEASGKKTRYTIKVTKFSLVK